MLDHPDAPDLYDALFEQSLDAVMLTEPGGGVLRANPAACRTLGCAEADVQRLGRAHFVVMDDVARQFIERRQGEGIARGVLTFRRLDGTPFPAEVASLLARAQGGRTLTYVIFRDLSGARRAERELAESERRLRLFVELAPAAIAMVDREMRYLAVSRRWLADFGLADANVIGRSHDDVFPDLPERWKEIHRRCLAGASDRARADPFPRLDGRTDWIDWEIHPWRDADGGVGGLLLFSEVVTARKQAQHDLEARERRFRSLVENSQDLTLVLDPEGRITYASGATARVLGLPPEAVLGRNFFDFVAAEDRDGGPARLAALLAVPGATAQRRYRIGAPDGGWRTVDLTARNRLDDPAVDGVVVNGREVTRELLLQEQFQQAQKLESVGRLAGGVAHDFNNLLTVILSCARALGAALQGDGAPDPDDAAEIEAAANRAAELTQRLLTFARKQVIAPRTLDLHRTLRGARSILQRLVGEDVAVSQSLEATRTSVRWDPVQLEQVLLNLAVNARDAMPQGGALSLETRDLPPGHPARPATLGAGAYVRLTFRDTGPGITDDVRAHLFEPFFTTKPQGTGTGLGLATVYGIVKQNGGEIAVGSPPGRGTAVEIFLPIVEPDAAADAAPPVAVPRGTEAVLLVEDDASVRAVTARALRAGGYAVTAVESGPAALVAVQGGFSPALLVTDVVMPGMGGRTLTDVLRAVRPELRVLYVSGYSRDALSRQALLDEGIDLLSKPYTAESLLTRVRAALDRR